MTHVFFREELEGVPTFWRIYRKDGRAFGFTSHDRNLVFGGLTHLAAPGMVPSSIRRTSDLSPDSAEVQGVLSHDSISAPDLSSGRFDGAAIQVGAVDWETLDHTVLYHGSIGTIAEQGGEFTAELRSAKFLLDEDPVPRTSPTCRAEFCGPGCNLSAPAFTVEAVVAEVDFDANSVIFAGIDPASYLFGWARWIGGAEAGIRSSIIASDGPALVFGGALPSGLQAGDRALLREGCDHTFATCNGRFSNAANFRGEPFLPGNDLLARYPLPE